MNAALALRDIPDYQAALQQLQKAISADPANVVALLLMGLTYRDLDDLNRAEDCLRQAALIASDSNEVRLSLGLLLAQRGKYDEVIQQLEPLIDIEGYTPTVALTLGGALVKLHRTARAAEVLANAYKRWPGNAEITAQLGQVLLNTNHFQEAIEVLQQAFRLNPIPQVICDLAGAYSVLQRYDEALLLYRQLVQSQPKYDRAWRGLAYCDLKQGRAEQALQEAVKAVDLNSQHFRNWQARADALLALGRATEAMSVSEKGIELAQKAPDGRDVLREWIVQRVLLILQTRGAVTALEQLRRDQGDYPDLLVLWSIERDILLATGDYQRASMVLDALRTKGSTPESLAPYYYHAYLGLGEPERARAVLQSTIRDGKLEPKLLDRIEEIGRRLYATGNYEGARTAFEQELDYDAKRPLAQNNLAFLLMCDQQWERAETLLKAALENGYTPPAIPHANLGYLYLRQQRPDLAIQELTIAEQLFGDSPNVSTLHVADWHNGGFVNAPSDCFPRRGTSPLLVVRVNVAIAYLMKGQIEVAIAAAQRAIDTKPGDNIGYRVLGSLYLHMGDMKAAGEALEKALTRDSSPVEREMIQAWLSELT